MTSAHLALLHRIAAGAVKAMRRSDGALQVWVDGDYTDQVSELLAALVDAKLVAPPVGPKAKPVTMTGKGRERLEDHEQESAA